MKFISYFPWIPYTKQTLSDFMVWCQQVESGIIVSEFPWTRFFSEMDSQVVYELYMYSRLSLSRPRLSRITAYLEEKIRSLF